MSLSGRKLRSARQSRPTSPTHQTNNEDEGAHQAPPKKEKQKRRQKRRQDTRQAPSEDTTVASGRNGHTATPSGQTGQAEDEDEEETAEEDGRRQATVRSKRRRPQQLHLSPDNRKRTRQSARLRVANGSSAHQEATDSGEEPDISDLELDEIDTSVGSEDEDALLKSEAQHLIDEFEQGRQSDAESEDDEEDEGEGLVFEITNISQNGEDVLLTWSEAEGELYRAPLEGFLALADEPLEGGVISSMWYQDATDFDQDHSHHGGSGESGSELDIDEAADQLLFVQGLDSSDSDEDGVFTDEGETTDSLDDGDELALIRFGIEVDEPAYAVGMSPLQVGETTIDMDAFAHNPELVIQQTAQKLGVNLETAAKIITGVGISVMARNGTTAPSRQRRLTAGEPEMGEFTSSRATGSSIVIDDKAPPAPSPFSAPRGLRKRRESQGSPLSARPRRSSLHSSQSSHTLTPIESPKSAAPSTSPPTEALQEEPVEGMELEDVLHDELLEPVQEEVSEASESEMGQEDSTDFDSMALAAGSIQIDDLDRWDRVPIGAFRRSRGDRSPTSSVPNGRRRYVPTSGPVYKGSPALLPVKRAVKGRTSGLKPSPKALRNSKVGVAKRGPPASVPVKHTGRSATTSLRRTGHYTNSPRTRSRAATPRAGSSRHDG